MLVSEMRHLAARSRTGFMDGVMMAADRRHFVLLPLFVVVQLPGVFHKLPLPALTALPLDERPEMVLTVH